MRLYLIRHGVTDWNNEKRLQGKSDIPLNAFGELLAKETGEVLRDIPFDLAYTSPLIRARRTAELVIGKRSVPILDDPRIEEIGLGIYEGLICKGEGSEIRDPNFFHFFHAPELYQPPEGGESFEELLQRTGSFLEELRKDPRLEHKTILISTHGATLCALLCHIKELPLRKFWDEGVHKNCAVTVVDVTNEGYEILEEGNTYYKEEVKPW